MGGGLTFTAPYNINVQFDGNYRFYYTVASARAAKIGFRVMNGNLVYVDSSTVWNTGVPKATILGIGIFFIPGGSTIQLINYANSNSIILQQWVNAAVLIEKVG
jgi:hypothetical protein